MPTPSPILLLSLNPPDEFAALLDWGVDCGVDCGRELNGVVIAVVELPGFTSLLLTP
jgi:hypothetical protein